MVPAQAGTRPVGTRCLQPRQSRELHPGELLFRALLSRQNALSSQHCLPIHLECSISIPCGIGHFLSPSRHCRALARRGAPDGQPICGQKPAILPYFYRVRNPTFSGTCYEVHMHGTGLSTGVHTDAAFWHLPEIMNVPWHTQLQRWGGENNMHASLGMVRSNTAGFRALCSQKHPLAKAEATLRTLVVGG